MEQGSRTSVWLVVEEEEVVVVEVVVCAAVFWERRIEKEHRRQDDRRQRGDGLEMKETAQLAWIHPHKVHHRHSGNSVKIARNGSALVMATPDWRHRTRSPLLRLALLTSPMPLSPIPSTGV